MITISPTVTIISAILIVVVLIIAFRIRGKIQRNERGNEFFPWERTEAQGDDELHVETDEGTEDNGCDDEDEDEDEGEDEDEDGDGDEN
jgi:hypothetical protein